MYDRIDNLNDEEMLKDLTGSEEVTYPKATKTKVTVGGKDLKVTCKIGKNFEDYLFDEFGCEYIDISVAEANILPNDVTYEFLQKNNRIFGEYTNVDIALDPDAPALDEEIVEKRNNIIVALGHLFSTEEMLKNFAGAAPKKKDGTFNKAKVFRIASTGMVKRKDENKYKYENNFIFEIYGKATKDDTLTIFADDRKISEKEFEQIREDYVSTHFDELGLGRYL